MIENSICVPKIKILCLFAHVRGGFCLRMANCEIPASNVYKLRISDGVGGWRRALIRVFVASLSMKQGWLLIN